MIPSLRGVTPIRLAAIVDAMNAQDISGIKIEKHTPFAGTETVKPIPVRKHFGITLASVSIARERSENSHCSITVQFTKIGAGGRFPNNILLHEFNSP